MSFRLIVMTPSGVKIDNKIDGLFVFSKSGMLGILPNHAPLITTLEIAPMKIDINGIKHNYAIFGGVLYVEKNITTIVTSNIEDSDNIDLSRAIKSKERAEKRLSDKNDKCDVDLKRAKASLLRAIARIKASNNNF